MGMIREQHGTITVESRRESFYVHAGYGYVPGKRRLGDLALGTDVVFDGKCWRVTVLAEEYVALRDSQFSTVRELAPDTMVEVPGYEEDAPGSHAALWRNNPHPEFLYDDLDDLIAALVELRESRDD